MRMRFTPPRRASLPLDAPPLRLHSRGRRAAGGSLFRYVFPPGRPALAIGTRPSETVTAARPPLHVRAAQLRALMRDIFSEWTNCIEHAQRTRVEERWQGMRIDDMEMLDSLLHVQRDAIVGMLSYPTMRAEMTLVAERIGRFPETLWLPCALSGQGHGTDSKRFTAAMDCLFALLEQTARLCVTPITRDEQNVGITDSPFASTSRHAEETSPCDRAHTHATLDSIADAVISTNLSGDIRYLNRAAEEATGWSLHEALGRPLTEVLQIVNALSGLPTANPVLQAVTENRTVALEADSVLLRRNGSLLAVEDSTAPIHDHDGVLIGAVIVLRDVSESRAAAQRMSHLAQHDALTGLPNRVLLTERLSQAILRGQRHNTLVALLYLDIDHFKRFNDSLGHAVGDRLLQLMAARLLSCVRAVDTVCRQGGDEFLILLAEIDKRHDAAQVAEKLLAAVDVPQRVGAHELQLSYSIGISVFPHDGHDAPSLVHSADIAMYQAKAKGRNNYQFFEAGQDATSSD